jgi:metal-responsive CopG/Arc/MetJ family transcriptional regulator
LQEKETTSEVIRHLVRKYSVSVRQARRYVRLAQETPAPLAIPQEKTVFTVKLPQSLIRQVREIARRRGGPISDWVAQALRSALAADSPHG